MDQGSREIILWNSCSASPIVFLWRKPTRVACRDSRLSPFLRRYTTCGVYTRCRSLGVEVWQRLKEYPRAIRLLRSLLAQTVSTLVYKLQQAVRLQCTHPNTFPLLQVVPPKNCCITFFSQLPFHAEI